MIDAEQMEWHKIERILSVTDATLLWGRPGTGKTHSAVHAPRPDGTPLYMVTATEETPAAELRGMFVPKGGEFVWMPMVYSVWWATGGRLVIDEADKLSNDAVTLTLTTLNDPSVAQMTLPTGETIRPRADVWRQVVCTTNAHPGDMLPALVDRLWPHIEIQTPHENAFLVLPETLREAARNAILSGRTDSSASLRAWLTMAKLRTRLAAQGLLSPDDATELACEAVWGRDAQAMVDSIRLVASK